MNDNVYHPEVKVTFNIFHTVADTVYADTFIKIREAVANSFDNKAKKFVIFFDEENHRLSLFDDGNGISEDHLIKILINFGTGLLKKDSTKLSYYGLGLMSIIQLGSEVIFFSKTEEDESVLKVTFNSNEIFSEQNEDRPIDELSNFIYYEKTDLNERNSTSPFNGNNFEKNYINKLTSFTEIVVNGLNISDYNTLLESTFASEFSKYLPLKPDEEHVFFEKIKDENKLCLILDVMQNDEYCPTIEVFFGIKGNSEFTNLIKYFPTFKDKILFNNDDIKFGINNEYAYYFLTATEALEEKVSESGIWVRNLNFLVSPSDYLTYRGQTERFDNNLHGWIFGEIFHKNMNDFLVLSRMDFNKKLKKYKKFADEINSILFPLNSKLRKYYDIKKDIKEKIIDPIKNIDKSFEKTLKRLSKMGIGCSGESAKILLDKLEKTQVDDPEIELNRIDSIISDIIEPIDIKKDDEVHIYIDPSLESDECEILTDEKRVKMRIPLTFFNPKRVIFAGETFEAIMIGKENYKAVYFNITNHKIYINLLNKNIADKSLSFLDVIIAIEIAYQFSKNKDEMRESMYNYLGEKVSKYVSSFYEGSTNIISRRRY